MATRARPVVVTVFGTRPQFIKLAMLWQSLEQHFRSVLIDSGQHYDWDMAGAFLKETGMRKPDHHLGVTSPSAGSQIGRVADALDSRLARLAPDAVIVIGDTSTTAGGAIAGAYRGIPVAHVEAGLRSHDLDAPEEKNRIIADHLAQWRFCPTSSAIVNLRREDIRTGVHGVGDLMYEHFLRQGAGRHDTLLLPHGVEEREYYFVTAHRAENVDPPDRLRQFVTMIRSLDRPVVYAVHPRAERNLRRLNLWKKVKHARQLHLLPPQSYGNTLSLIRRSRAVLTDSGGVQREAYWSGVPCLILRECTEWRELLACGAGVLVGLDSGSVRRKLKRRSSPRRVSDPVFSRRRPSDAIARMLARDLGDK